MLYIYGGNKDCNKSLKKEDYVYHINTGKISSNGKYLDDLEEVHNIALNIRDSYVDYINSINSLFLENNLIHNDDISLFYFSDLFNKRSEVFDTFTFLCHVIFINKKILNKYKIDQIISDQCTEEFNIALSSIITNSSLIIKNEINNQNKNIYNMLRQLKFFFDSIIKLIIIKLSFRNNKFKNLKTLFLSRYPLQFNKNFQENKYGKYFTKDDTYLISIITDGFHQKTSLWNIYKYVTQLNDKNIILLDYYLNITDLIKGYYINLQINNKSSLLFNNKYLFKDIDITKFIHIELSQSFIRIPRLLCYYSPIKKILKKYTFSRFIFYLHEYSYGRYFNYVLTKNRPDIERVGFQHGPTSKRKLLYYLGKNITSNDRNDWLRKTPIPNLILAEDDSSKSIYESAGYKNVKIMDRIYRLDYMNKIKRDKKLLNTVLIVPGLHDGLYMLKKLKPIIISNPKINYILKTHPRSNHFRNGLIHLRQIKNLSIGNEHISNYLTIVSEVFSTYSSVGLEAYLLGIKSNVICLPNKINESPLIDIYEKTSDDLINIIW